jgi:hypothetical protein
LSRASALWSLCVKSVTRGSFQTESANLSEKADRGPASPRESLGQTFPNDAARREHITARLRAGLEELHARLDVPFTTVDDALSRLRQVEHWPMGEDERLREPAERIREGDRGKSLLQRWNNEVGFPHGEIEDILNLTDPPYFTACFAPRTKEEAIAARHAVGLWSEDISGWQLASALGAPPHLPASPVAPPVRAPAPARTGTWCTFGAAASFGSGPRAGVGRFAANCRSQAAPASSSSEQQQALQRVSGVEASFGRHPAILPQRGGRASAPAFWCAAMAGGILPLRSGVEARRCIGCAAGSFRHREHRLLRAVRVGRSVAVGSSTSASRCCSFTSASCRANQSLQWTQGRP